MLSSSLSETAGDAGLSFASLRSLLGDRGGKCGMRGERGPLIRLAETFLLAVGLLPADEYDWPV